MQWDIVIGLEIHVQLATKTKIFSGSSTAYGAEPNTQANAVDLAMPGTLPVPNEQAFRYAVMFGLAVNAEIERRSVFERKTTSTRTCPRGIRPPSLSAPLSAPATWTLIFQTVSPSGCAFTTPTWKRMRASPCTRISTA